MIGGHQRLVAARRLGMATVPVTWLDIGVEQARVLGLALNKISGSWDEQLLARLLADLRTTDGVDLTLSGFDDEVSKLLKGLDRRERRERPETFDLETALEAATREPRTKPGELWRLGDHRLVCGDATVAADVDRLLERSYEPIWYGWREGEDHHWCGDRDQGDVWSIARPAEAPLHPVMKPLPLMERAISNSSREGDLVLDLFLGAGSTLIAAERTGRACLGLELDPRYCDVSLARWESFTGGQAERTDG